MLQPVHAGASSAEQPACGCCQSMSRRTLLSAAAAVFVLAQPQQALAAPAAAGGPQALLAPSSGSAAGPRILEGEAKAAVLAALRTAVEKPKAPVVLRLAFHDAGTYDVTAHNGGPNGSIQYELDRPENFGLKRGWRVIEGVRSALKGTAAAASVSDADLIALAGGYAVQICGGPPMNWAVGRQDVKSGDPTGRLPAETLSSAQLRANFAQKGFSTQELVALSGAHTLGAKGFGEPYAFDNTYYKELLKKPWTDPKNEMGSMIGLPSDHVLPDDQECRPVIEMYAQDQAKFHSDFAVAYRKLTNSGAIWT
ncbi:hypothetical protein WJX72_007848 [[Myrmecia] bisecta]|uniref:L-ascorbate peroxidase n=1 Tax=[Myrmecia] bisecta TaxID=41462 RepID=A0AAW1PHS3_9CHLO